MHKIMEREYLKYRAGTQAAHELRLGALGKYSAAPAAAECYLRLEKTCAKLAEKQAKMFEAYVEAKIRQTEEQITRKVKAYFEVFPYLERYRRECG